MTQTNPQTEARRTDPDFVIYVPRGNDDSVESRNVHVIVTPTPGGIFLATWTQADVLHGPNQRIVVSRSHDRGQTWTEPEVIDEPEPGTEHIASWSNLVVAPETGRVYCLYHKNKGVDFDRGHTGVLAWRVSDDEGTTWSDRFQTTIGRGAIDHPDEGVPSNWVTAGWQAPIVTETGQVLCPITRWASPSYHQREPKSFALQHHEAWFLRFENILTEPDPSKLEVTTLPRADHGIRVPNPEEPGYSASMEPAIQNLSDGRIFCLLRTMTGSIFYSVSGDFGETWSEPDVLRYAAGGAEVHHPNSPCPLFRLEDGRYLLFYHNNDGTANGGTGPGDVRSRGPVFVSVGHEIDNPDGQPVAFADPKLFYDNGGKSGLALYGSFFEHDGVRYWWYPDAMRFLLGKVVRDELLNDAGLPS